MSSLRINLFLSIFWKFFHAPLTWAGACLKIDLHDVGGEGGVGRGCGVGEEGGGEQPS